MKKKQDRIELARKIISDVKRGDAEAALDGVSPQK
jgi:hypothetical protein